MSPSTHSEPNRRLQIIAGMLSLIVVSFLVMQTSNAAFSGTTDNSANNWDAGTVTLTDDDGTSAMFNAANMVPGDVEEKCIVVSYTGSSFDLDSIRLYADVTNAGGLEDDLDVTIEQGSGGSFANCTGFIGTSTPVSGVALSTFASTNSDYATAIDTGFTPAASPLNTVTFKFSVELGTDTANSEQGNDAGATFTWEVRSDDTTT